MPTEPTPATEPTEPRRPLAEVLAGLAEGSISVDDAEADFAGREWPVRRRAPRHEGIPDTTSDPEPEPPGSWAEVAAAYHAGRIDDATYARLAAAAAG